MTLVEILSQIMVLFFSLSVVAVGISRQYNFHANQVSCQNKTKMESRSNLWLIIGSVLFVIGLLIGFDMLALRAGV